MAARTASDVLFVTGATGFVGPALLAELSQAWAGEVRVLMRRPPSEPLPDGFVAVFGSLEEPVSYRAALEGADVVVHLAGLTGKAPASRYHAVNVAATAALLDAARTAGATRFLLVSSIAAGFADKAHYPYAVSKLEAEAVVKTSGVACAILRPTMILGPGSPIGAAFGKIAGLPVIPLPGRGHPVSIQPVHVADVARGITEILRADRFRGEILDLGGPERLTIADFLQRLRQAQGKGPARLVRLPLKPLQALLALLDPLRDKLPITAGQLASFANDSVAAPGWLGDRLAPQMRGLDAMIDAGRPPPASGPGPDVPDREARIFARYLAGIEADQRLTGHYRRACAIRGLDRPAGLDLATLALARRGGFATRAADAWCTLFRRRGILRRRLVLMSALLESTAAGAPAYVPQTSGGPAMALLRLAGAAAAFLLALLLGTALLLPRTILARARS